MLFYLFARSARAPREHDERLHNHHFHSCFTHFELRREARNIQFNLWPPADRQDGAAELETCRSSSILRNKHACVNTARRVQAKIRLPLKCVRKNKQSVSQRSISCDCCLPASLDLMDRHCAGTKWKTDARVGAHLYQEPGASLTLELGQWNT